MERRLMAEMCPSAQLEYLERIAQVEHIVRMHDLNICNHQPQAANTYDLNMFIHRMRSDLAPSLFIPSHRRGSLMQAMALRPKQ